MRISKEILEIDYEHTKIFFEHRAKKFNENNPYSVTMYQDDNPKLVEKRNIEEIRILKPLLKINCDSKILDIACGIGRWSDEFGSDVKKYYGIDFSNELISIAINRNKYSNHCFAVGSANDVENLVQGSKFNRILMIGILMYINDNDLISLMNHIVNCCEHKSIICIREPIGIEKRLTLKDHYSAELADNYNAIYRSREELLEVFEITLIKSGFRLKDNGFLFPDNLNNRRETSQYYYIFERD